MEPKKVLIIEDDKTVAELIAEFCSLMGYTARIRNEGTNILNTVRFFRPDIITLDLMLPDISGFDLLETLKADPLSKDIPVIVISAVAGHSHIYSQLKQYPWVMDKPIRISTFKNTLNRALSSLHA